METLEIYAFLEWMKQTITDNNASYNQIMNEFLNLRNEVQELKKEIKELTEPKNGIPIRDAAFKINDKPIGKVTKMESKPRGSVTSEIENEIKRLVPSYTNKEVESIAKCLKKTYSKNMSMDQVDNLLKQYVTLRNLGKILPYRKASINAALGNLVKKEEIHRVKLDESYKPSPVIYYKIKHDVDVSEEPVVDVDDLEYQFSKSYTNPGFELINHMYIKTKRGKQVPVNAKQLKELCKIIDGKVLTNSLFDDCCKYLKNEDINESYFERIIYHLTKGHFKMVLFKYDSYRSLEVNVKFDVSDENTVRVNGHDTKLTPVEVKRMTDNYPYGYPVGKVEEYTRECMMKYPFCRPDCIRLILENSEKSDLKRILKKKEDFKMDKREKRIANGIIAG